MNEFQKLKDKICNECCDEYAPLFAGLVDVGLFKELGEYAVVNCGGCGYIAVDPAGKKLFSFEKIKTENTQVD